MTMRLTKSLAADGWYKNGKSISKKCANGGFVNMDKAHYQGCENARFYLSFTGTSSGFLRTYSKGDYPNLDDALAAGNVLSEYASAEAIVA